MQQLPLMENKQSGSWSVVLLVFPVRSTAETQANKQVLCVGPGTHRTSRCGRPVNASEGTPRRRLPSRRKLRSAGTCWKVVPSSFQISLLPRCLTQQYPPHHQGSFYRKLGKILTIPYNLSINHFRIQTHVALILYRGNGNVFWC